MNEQEKGSILGEALKAELKQLFKECFKEEMAAIIQSRANSKDWLKAEELAAEYNLPKTWFEERGRRGEIARTKPGRYVLFKRRDVERYLEEHKKNNGGGLK